MKNGLYASLFIIILGACCHFGLPWWAIVPIAGLAAIVFPQKPSLSFGTAFAAGTLLWYGSALFFNSINGGLLSAKIGQLFLGLKGAHLIMITGVLGGTLAGLGALTGTFFRGLFEPRAPQRYRGRRPTFKV
jgi:hypothetical protein